MIARVEDRDGRVSTICFGDNFRWYDGNMEKVNIGSRLNIWWGEYHRMLRVGGKPT